MSVQALPVKLTSEPQDVCILEGRDAFFPCTYNGTSTQSLWRINGSVHSTTRLPINHRFNNSGLVVKADVSLNMSTYSYLIQVLTADGVMLLESHVAFLTVVIHMATLGKFTRTYGMSCHQATPIPTLVLILY